jgi:tetratricopeptide (TPR) repeat protein
VCIADYQMDRMNRPCVHTSCKTEHVGHRPHTPEHDEPKGNLQEQARTHVLTASAFLSGGELVKAYEYYNKGLCVYISLHDKRRICQIYGKLGVVLFKQGFFLQAIGMCTKQLDSAPKNNLLMKFEAHGLMGDAYSSIGRFPDAKNSYKLSLELATEMGDARCIALESGRQGIVHELSGDLENALVCYNTQLVYGLQAGDSYLLAAVYTYMASVFRKMEMNILSVQYQQKAICIARRVGDRVSEGVMLDGLGAIYQYIHDYQTAIKFHTLALDIAILAHDKLGEAIACGNLGVAYFRVGEFQKSEEYMKRDLSITVTTEDSIGVGITSTNLHLARKKNKP